MAHCPKCDTLNDERLTRCRACRAILPVKMEAALGSAPHATPRRVDRTGLRCARCGTINPYSRFKCERCGASLTQYQPQGLRQRALVYAGLLALVALIVMALLRAM